MTCSFLGWRFRSGDRPRCITRARRRLIGVQHANSHAGARRTLPFAPAPKPQRPYNQEPFGVDVTLTPRTIIYMKGNGSWDNALETLQDAFKSVYAFLDKQGIQRAGPPMTICLDFKRLANFPVSGRGADRRGAPRRTRRKKGDIAVDPFLFGKALRFVYKGSFHQMEDTIYNAIPEYLDEGESDQAGGHVHPRNILAGTR